MPSFGLRSTERLHDLCPQLRECAYDVIQILDHSIIETARSKALQDRYVAIGASKVEWPKSKHNVTSKRPKALALDVWPYVKPYGALSGNPIQIDKIARDTGRSKGEVKEFVYKAFARLAGAYELAGWQRGYTVRWGGDWDGDGNLIDQSFHDLPHIELVEE